MLLKLNQTKMNTQLLRNKETFPSLEVLKDALKDSYLTYEKMKSILADPEYGLTEEWNYYNDGKAWLCKICLKKKTLFWLSVWDGFFKTSFYFTEKNSSGLADLDINKSLKENFFKNKTKSRLIPLTIDIYNIEQLKDLLTLISYKKNLK